MSAPCLSIIFSASHCRASLKSGSEIQTPRRLVSKRRRGNHLGVRIDARSAARGADADVRMEAMRIGERRRIKMALRTAGLNEESGSSFRSLRLKDGPRNGAPRRDGRNAERHARRLAEASLFK